MYKIGNIDFQTESMLHLYRVYSELGPIQFSDKRPVTDETVFEQLLGAGMPILFNNEYAYRNKNEASEVLVNAVGPQSEVKIRLGNYMDPEEYAFARQTQLVTMKEFMEAHFNNRAEDLSYLGNQPLSEIQLARLNIKRPSFYSTKNVSNGALWIGKKGCITPLHCDGTDIFVHQLLGKKKWILFPPSNFPNLNATRPTPGTHPEYFTSSLDLRHLDKEARKDLNLVGQLKVSLNGGDSMFMPAGWFHYVETQEDSVMINFWLKSKDQI